MSKSILIEQTGSEDFLNRIGLLIDEKLNSILSKSFKSQNDDKILTIDETAKLLGVCRTSLYNYEKLGLLKPSRVGKTTRYLKSEVMNYLKNQNDE